MSAVYLPTELAKTWKDYLADKNGASTFAQTKVGMMLEKTAEALMKLETLRSGVEDYFSADEEGGWLQSAAAELGRLLGSGRGSLANELRVGWAGVVKNGQGGKMAALVAKSVTALGQADYFMDEVEGFFAGDYEEAEQIESALGELHASLTMSAEVAEINY